MKTTGREYYYSVSGLMVPKYMVNDKLESNIDKFVEQVPKITDKLESFLRNNLRIELFVSEMEKLYTLLCSIHSRWLEVEAARILRLTEVNEGELCRSLLTPFITNVRTLAIDIQMAQNKGFEGQYHMRGETERCRDVVSSMRIITKLLDNDEFSKAHDIAKTINELQESGYLLPLIAYILARDKDRALDMAEEIREIYKQRIEDVNKAAKPTVLKQIVVVDDMPEILTVVSRILKDYYHVLPFTSGNEALKAIDAKHKPDAFLLDVDMPKMDGFLLAEKIRQKPGHKNTPILFLTANSTRENLIQSTNYNPKAFIVKPVNKDIIISRLNSCLAEYNGSQAG